MRSDRWLESRTIRHARRAATAVVAFIATTLALGIIFAPGASAAEACPWGFGLCNLNFWEILLILLAQLLGLI